MLSPPTALAIHTCLHNSAHFICQYLKICMKSSTCIHIGNVCTSDISKSVCDRVWKCVPHPKLCKLPKSSKWDQHGQKDSLKEKYTNINPYAKAKVESEILLLLSSLAAQNLIIYFLGVGGGVQGKFDTKVVIVRVSFALHPQECCYSPWSQCCHHSFSPPLLMASSVSS